MANSAAFTLEKSWHDIVGGELDKPYMHKLQKFLRQEKDAGKVIYPKDALIFNALNSTPFDNVKVVIIGQDPYHGEGQAHGLSFSVPRGIAIPPSLLNIYKELEASLGIKRATHGDLGAWAQQGVLLLNATLTVEHASAASHQRQGWEEFTDAVIRAVNDGREHVVFMLWGAYAQKKGAFIDRQKHLVLDAPHPSPLSAHRGFLGCGHFKKANDYLTAHNRAAIEWQRLDA